MHGKTDRDRHRGKECQSVLCFVFSVIGVLCRRNLDLCAMYRICVRVLKFCHFENNAWHFGVYSEGSAAIHSHINIHTRTHMMWSDQTDGKMQHKFCAFSKIVRSMVLYEYALKYKKSVGYMFCYWHWHKHTEPQLQDELSTSNK